MTKDDDLRWRLELLKKALDDGKVQFAPHLIDGVKKSFEAVRTNEDGLVDLSTVDGRIRAMSLAIAGFHHRDESKKLISLHEVQARYFDYVEHTFGDIYESMVEKGSNAQAVAWMLSKNAETVQDTYKIISPFIDELSQFWSSAAESCEYHLQDIRKLKGVFGGDLFPSYSKNIASSTGLYLDTIILTDPFMNSRKMFDIWDPETAVRFFVKHGLNVLGYKDLALAELATPIIAIAPFKSSIDADEADLIMRIAEPDILKHGETLFGNKFSNLDDLREFTVNLDTIGKAIAAIKRPDRFLFDAEWAGNVEDQLIRAIKEQSFTVNIDHPGQLIFVQCVGRMRQATDILIKSRNLLGTPLIDAETSWRYLNWKLEYDAALGSTELLPLHVVKGLQRAGETDMEWIGDIPPQALIEMRREGAMDEIRAMISEGVEEVATANPTNFFRSADRIVDNIQNAFDKHQENVRSIRSKGMKFWGQDIGSWIVKGTIEIGAAISGAPAFGLAALGIDQVMNSPKLNEIPGRFRELQEAKAQHAKSPMGLFFKHKS